MGNSNKAQAPRVDGNGDRVTEEKFLDLCELVGDEKAVRSVLEKQPELVECKDSRRYAEGFTPLHHASREGHDRVVRVLLEHGANVNARDQFAATPLHYTSYRGHVEVVRLLLEHGAEVSVSNNNGWKPIHFACVSSYKTVAQLLESGAEVHALNVVGWTPLHSAANTGIAKVAEVLLEHGAEVNRQSDDGWTPLHRACVYGHEGMVRVLLEHGADRSMKNNDGATARDEAERLYGHKVVPVLDTYFPVPLQMAQVLLGLRGPTESPLTRFARHSTFEPQVLSLIKCLLTGEQSAAFEQLQREVND